MIPIEESQKRKSFKNLLIKLSKDQIILKNPREKSIIYQELENIYYDKDNKGFRHYYSDIFEILTDEDLDRDTLGQNVTYLRNNYQAINKDVSDNTIDGDWKFNQLINAFNFSGGGLLGWYNNVDASPRFRIDEFVNIFLEYVKKPWYALFGKGNAGTILHTYVTMKD